ncbi:uncharacterized protein LOC116351853 [Contarinia nasturtii]|uniref:uncharacterized protein LOC116351853 n=1 Tax=Contarinia nasturtii TaxID=265458 RepID=UPI0012D373C2|nr:uncharacterized protein LOC116351853 [Contarinia nasturtii]
MNTEVSDFVFVTWNTEGSNWENVAKLMLSKEGVDRIDVMALQECSEHPISDEHPQAAKSGIGTISLPANEVENIQINPTPNQRDNSSGITTYLWHFNTEAEFFLYYRNNKIFTEIGAVGGSGKKSLSSAFVTRVEATRTFYMAPVDNNGSPVNNSDYNKNRPVIGIEVNGVVYFNIHGSHQYNNSVNNTIRIIKEFMARNHPAIKWVMMGDFNKTPLEINTAGLYLMEPNTATRAKSGKIIDYAISNDSTVGNMHIHVSRDNHGSDHFPVEFINKNINHNSFGSF